MANLLYRASTTPTVPLSTTAKNAPLTNLEVDGNFKSIDNELDLKAPLLSPTFTGTVGGITATMVGLGNVTNESKATMFTSPTFTGTVGGITATMVGLGNVTNESKATMFTSPTFTGNAVVSSTAAIRIPVGTEAERPTGLSGHLRFNTTSTQFEGFNGTAWSSVGGAALSDDTTTDASYYPTLATATTGTALSLRVTSTKLYFNPSTGTLNATNFNSLSDITLKENVVSIQNATDTINSIDGVEFDWKDNGNKSAGVIAQKLEEILPHLVETSTDGIKSVNYSGLVAYLIEAVKQQDLRIVELERIINK